MRRVLILTVGGSCVPIVRSIQHHAPDHVYFVCSGGPSGSTLLVDGPGNVCGDRRTCPHCKQHLGDPKGTSIVAQTGLQPEHYSKIEITNPDDLTECYRAGETAMDAALAADTDAQLLVDYTGGTKTMTAALVRLATGRYARQASLFVVTGSRNDLRVVQNGTESVQSQDVVSIVIGSLLEEASRFFNTYYYAAADSLVRRVLSHLPAPPPPVRQPAQRLLTLCRGFDAWDRFDHSMANRLLRTEAALLEQRTPGLRSTLTVLAERAAAAPIAANSGTPAGQDTGNAAGERGRTGNIPAWGAHELLPVYDLLLNADRRADQGRYDDAVARQYRALELLAQGRLERQFGLRTGNLDPAAVTEWLATQPGRHTNGPLRIGLVDGYEVLASKNDPLGALWQDENTSLRTLLERRNQSILAHGLVPITQEEYQVLREPVWTFVRTAARRIGAKVKEPGQFPHIELKDLSPV